MIDAVFGRKTLDLIPLGVAITDAQGSIQHYNRRAAELLGRTPAGGEPDERLFEGVRLYGSDGALPHEQSPMAEVLRTRQPVRDAEVIVERPDGSRIAIVLNVGPLFNRDGEFVGAINCLQDITDRKQFESRLRYQSDLNIAITANAADCLFLLDPRGHTTYVNPAAEKTFGFTLEELRNRPLHDVVHYRHPDGHAVPGAECPLQRVLVTGRAIREHQDMFIRKDGSWVHVLCSNAPILDMDGQVTGAVLVAHDITERHRAAERLRSSNERVRLLADCATRLLMEHRPEELTRQIFDELAVHLGLEVYFNYLVSEDGSFLRLNACAGVDEAMCQRVRRLEFGDAVCGTVASTRQSMVVEDVQNCELVLAQIVRSIGLTAYACLPLLAHERLIGTLSFGSRTRTRFSSDELELMRAVCDQIAVALDRRRLADELQNRAQELSEANAAKDQFLAALSHELRTPLAPVLMTATAMEKDGSLPQQIREDLSLIRRNIELEARLIDDLLDLTRVSRGKLELHREAVDAHALLRETIQTCCGSDELGRKRLTIATNLRANPHHVWADAARLAQVFWNLIRNAIKFTPDGGRVEVRTANLQGDQLEVTIRDSGVGIEADLLPRIFDAFEQGSRKISRRFGGLGLGLAISKALIEKHGGTIRAFSDGPGRGATFTIGLPTMPAPQQRAPQSDQPAAQRIGLRILLVEDHEMTARVLERLLRGMNYNVATAGTVQHALDAARNASFDLLISDLGLPDGSGLDLMRQLKQIYHIKGIALSGYGMEEDIRRSREVGFATHLTKPVSIDKLRAAIDQIA